MRDFDKTVDVLVKAYLNDTLEKGSICGCAVGNLVVDSLGLVIGKHWISGRVGWVGKRASWWYIFSTTEGVQRIEPQQYEINSNAKEQIDSTGYTWQELARVEFAFETKKTIFDGLMAVVDVLADIHKIDLTVKENKKLLFNKQSYESLN